MTQLRFVVVTLWALGGSAFVADLRAQAQQGESQDQGPQLTKPPVLLQFVEASYPTVEPKPTGDVAVVLDLVIDATGHVTEASVQTSAGAAFDEAALVAARQFVFSPAEIDHVPSPIRIAYQYVFTLRQEVVAISTAALSGRVINEATREPLVGVQVELHATPGGESAPGAASVVQTDAEGRFSFADLQPGTVTITLSGQGFSMLQTQETLVAAEAIEVTYEVTLETPDAPQEDGDDMEILVRAPPALRREVVSTTVSAQQARSIPGAQGDVLRVVESLPGVGRSAVGTGALVVWGAAPEDTRTYVDGVPIPRLYHEGGLRSTIHSGVVESVELVPGGWGAAYGRGLGGLVRVVTKTPDRTGLHGGVSLDLYDASLSLDTDVVGAWRAQFAGRLSVIDQLAKVADSDLGGYAPIPRYRDAQLRLTHRTSATQHVDVVALISSDFTARGVPNADPALVTREQRTTDFYRVYANAVSEGADGTRTVLTPFFGHTSQDLGNRFGDVNTSVQRDEQVFGLRASHGVRVATWLSTEVGIDAEITQSTVRRTGSLALPAREGDVRVFGQPPPDVAGFDVWNSSSIGAAPYIEADLSPWSNLHLIPGLRVDPLLQSVDNVLPRQGDVPSVGSTREFLAVEPRMSLRYQPIERVTVHGAVGRYRQPPSAQDLSATFGNPLLPPSRATHYVLGVSATPVDGMSVELTGFLTHADDVAMRNPVSAPLRAEALQPVGEGRARGVQALVRAQLGERVFGWITYTLMRAERRNFEGAAWRKLDFDQTHVLTALAVWSPWKGFEVGGRFRYATGMPRTVVTGAYYDVRRDRYQPTFGAQNMIRLPAFIQVDLRASQTFELGDTELQGYLELQNVTARQNAEDYVFSPDYRSADTIKSLPFLPVAGVQWNF